jgi:hypothetical protein
MEKNPLPTTSTAVAGKMRLQALFGHESGYQWGSSEPVGSTALHDPAQMAQLDLIGALVPGDVRCAR